MKKVRVTYGLLSFLFLVMGICVYLLFRDVSGLLFFEWVPKPEFVNVYIQLPPSVFSYVLRHNTAAMLWIVSGALFFRFIWFYRVAAQKIYIGCFYGMAAILEISQLSSRIPGTFDVLDLLFMGIGAFVEGLLYNIFVKRRIA